LFLIETLSALLAGERLLSSVNSHVNVKVSKMIETLSTVMAGETLVTTTFS